MPVRPNVSVISVRPVCRPVATFQISKIDFDSSQSRTVTGNQEAVISDLVIHAALDASITSRRPSAEKAAELVLRSCMFPRSVGFQLHFFTGVSNSVAPSVMLTTANWILKLNDSEASRS